MSMARKSSFGIVQIFSCCLRWNNCLQTHTRLTALFPGLPRWAGTRKVKPIWIFLKRETVSGSGSSWAICKFVPRSTHITTPAPNHSAFYRLDALPAAQPTGQSTEGLIIAFKVTCKPDKLIWLHLYTVRQEIHYTLVYCFAICCSILKKFSVVN